MKNGNMKSLQIAQNKLLRFLTKTSIKERTCTRDLLSMTGLLSVNQLAASFKLCEVWKSENITDYPVHLEPNNQGLGHSDRSVRPTTSRKFNQDAKSTAAKESFSRNATKLWNSAPQCIKTPKSLSAAKKEIIKYCSTLPI